jgi:anti-sigma factor RsiW
MNKKILKLLYRSFDDGLSEKERKQLEEALEASTEIQREKEQIAAERQAISASAVQSFKPGFAERVMSRIQAMGEEENTLEAFYGTLKAVFRRLAVAAAVIMIALITINLIIGECLSAHKAFYISELTFEEVLQLPLF